ncbi:MAG: hypothetical protein WB799_15245 [Candidatus Sulfotelmatobacter sp.]
MIKAMSFCCGSGEGPLLTLQMFFNDGDINPPGSDDIESRTDTDLAPRLSDSTKIDEIPPVEHCEEL